jgi:hypothetical protein
MSSPLVEPASPVGDQISRDEALECVERAWWCLTCWSEMNKEANPGPGSSIYCRLGEPYRLNVRFVVNTDNNYNACDTNDKDPQPAKRWKRCAAATTTLTNCCKHTPELCLRHPSSYVALPTATPEIDDAANGALQTNKVLVRTGLI